jgi:UDP-N-acetylmuramate dehydrogenase
MNAMIRQNVPLAPFTTFHRGGEAANFAEAHTEEEVRDACLFAKENGLALTILGGGSNVLIGEKGLPGLVLHIALKGITHEDVADGVILSAKAGETFDDVVAYALAHDLWGLENLSYIPGTVGATPVQNVGAYGVEIKDLCKEVRVYDTESDAFHILPASSCAFAYRDSLFKRPEGKRYVITEVVFMLKKEAHPQIGYRDLAAYFNGKAEPSLEEIREAVGIIRSRKFPDWNIVGTAGSFFKNPIVSPDMAQRLHEQFPELPMFTTAEGMMKISLGYILDKALGLRGYREGGVMLYEEQALVLVAQENASAEEIKIFAQKIAEKVFDATGIAIEFEVNILF